MDGRQLGWATILSAGLDCHAGTVTATARSEAPLGVLCALPQEVVHLRSVLEAPVSQERGGTPLVRGRLDGRPVVLAESGIGKVAAALATTLLCDACGVRGVLFSGVAGGVSPDLDVGDVVIATQIIEVDYGRATDHELVRYRPGVIPIGRPGELAFAPPSGVLEAARRIVAPLELPAGARVAWGPITTSDAFVASERVRDESAAIWGALALDMESSAVAGVAERFGVPWLVVRALSDRAGTESARDFARFAEDAAATAAFLVRRLLDAFPSVGGPWPATGSA
jgi:adenosylhomocysteine nucleosidase